MSIKKNLLIDKEENMYIETYVSIKYGINIPSTCKALQNIIVHQIKKIFKHTTMMIIIQRYNIKKYD